MVDLCHKRVSRMAKSQAVFAGYFGENRSAANAGPSRNHPRRRNPVEISSSCFPGIS
jgi:hypothetical protein